MLEAEGRVKFDDAARVLGVSAMTVRRDLQDMERRDGSVRMVRGGAEKVGLAPFARRSAQAHSAKRIIAEKAGRLIEAKRSVAFDASTTAYQVLVDSNPRQRTVLLTHGVETFTQASGDPNYDAYITGGYVDQESGALVGPMAVQAVRGFRFEACVLSTNWLTADGELFEASAPLAELKIELVNASDQVILAVDSSKLSSFAAFRSVSLDRVDRLVTELDPTDARLDDFRDRVSLV